MRHGELANKIVAQPYLELLYWVALYLRANARGDGRPPDEQLHDLMDAIHNIPELISNASSWFTDQMIRENFLKPYDDKWAASTGFSLIEKLNAACERPRE